MRESFPVIIPGKEQGERRPVTAWATPDTRRPGCVGKIVKYLCNGENSPCVLRGECESWCAFGRAYLEGRRECGEKNPHRRRSRVKRNCQGA